MYCSTNNDSSIVCQDNERTFIFFFNLRDFDIVRLLTNACSFYLYCVLSFGPADLFHFLNKIHSVDVDNIALRNS